LDHWNNENVQLGSHPQILFRLREQRSQAVESLLADDFVLPVDTTIALTMTRFSNGAGSIRGIARRGIEKLFEKGQRILHPLRLHIQEWRQLPEHGVLHIEGSEIREIEVYFGFAQRNQPD
jgi:hypothetical protein